MDTNYGLFLCTVVDCGNPGIPMNGSTELETMTTTFGSIATHTCNTGFTLIGADRRECLDSGNWSRPLPICRSKYAIVLHSVL